MDKHGNDNLIKGYLDRAEFYLSNLKKLIENKNYKYKRSQRKDFFMSGLKQLIEKQNDENVQLKRKNSTLETENINLARIIKNCNLENASMAETQVKLLNKIVKLEKDLMYKSFKLKKINSCTCEKTLPEKYEPSKKSVKDIATESRVTFSGSPSVISLNDFNENSSKDNDLPTKNSQLQLLIENSTENRTVIEAGNSIFNNNIPKRIDVKSMQVETDGCINENLRDCEKLDSSENSNMCDNNSRQNPTRNQKEACTKETKAKFPIECRDGQQICDEIRLYSQINLNTQEFSSDLLKNLKSNLNEEKVAKIKLQIPKVHSEMHHLHSNDDNPTKLDNSSIESAVKKNGNTIFNQPISKIVDFEPMQIESDEFINENLNTGGNSSMSDNSLPQGPTKGNVETGPKFPVEVRSNQQSYNEFQSNNETDLNTKEVASDLLINIKRNLNEEKVSKIKLQMPKLHSEMHHLHSNNENPTKLDNSSIESAVKSRTPKMNRQNSSEKESSARKIPRLDRHHKSQIGEKPFGEKKLESKVSSVEIILDSYQRIYNRKYVKSWESVKEFKDWLAPSQNGAMAYCKWCKVKLIPKKHNLKEHSKSNKHELVKYKRNSANQ